MPLTLEMKEIFTVIDRARSICLDSKTDREQLKKALFTRAVALVQADLFKPNFTPLTPPPDDETDTA